MILTHSVIGYIPLTDGDRLLDRMCARYLRTPPNLTFNYTYRIYPDAQQQNALNEWLDIWVLPYLVC